MIGVMDTPELARTVVDAVNATMVPVAAELSVDSAERMAMDALRERDEYHEVVDQLAAAISRLTCVDIGEHSSGNDPWRNALAAAEALMLEAVEDVMSSPEIVTLSQADRDLIAMATSTVLAGREVVTPADDDDEPTEWRAQWISLRNDGAEDEEGWLNFADEREARDFYAAEVTRAVDAYWRLELRSRPVPTTWTVVESSGYAP